MAHYDCKFKLLLQTSAVCLLLPLHSLHMHISPNPLAHQGGVVIFVCLYSNLLQPVIHFLCPALVSPWTRRNGSVSILSPSSYTQAESESERNWKQKREKLKWETGREHTSLCGVLMYCRCPRYWPASGQQSPLSNTWNTNRKTHTEIYVYSSPHRLLLTRHRQLCGITWLHI